MIKHLFIFQLILYICLHVESLRFQEIYICPERGRYNSLND